ncbi:MAG TPA: hypothetical protein VIL34_01215 [Actinopolymorphaceae bacterium]|jgi:Mce-associated membrane protein
MSIETERQQARERIDDVAREPAAEPTTDPEPASEPAAEPPAQPTAARPLRWLPIALAVALAFALLVCAVLGYRVHAAREVERARAEGLQAAREAAKVFMAYDYRHLDRDFARAKRLLTGDFRAEYAKTTSRVVAPTATKTHAVVEADVRAASVISASPARVVTLLFVNQRTTSNRVSEPRTDLNRVRITVVRVDGRWLVSDVDAL